MAGGGRCDAEYQYLPETGPHGAWSVSTFRSNIGWQRAWRVIASGDGKALAQTYDNRKERHATRWCVAGDPLWTDYTAQVRFAPQSAEGRSGLVFRYHNDRCNYFFGVEGRKASLRLIEHETAFRQPYEKILAEAECDWTPGTFIKAVVSVQGNRMRPRG